MISEVVVATSSNDAFIYIWDIRSGTLLTTFKGNKTDTHALALLSPLYQPARKAYIYSAQNDRPQINVWSFRKVFTISLFLCILKKIKIMDLYIYMYLYIKEEIKDSNFIYYKNNNYNF